MGKDGERERYAAMVDIVQLPLTSSTEVHTHTEFWHYQDPWNYTHTGNNTSHLPSLSLTHHCSFLCVEASEYQKDREKEGGIV